ncbi:MAG TPA: peptidoglycan binding domain-containing protein, partial [Labilithrix sp.]
MSVPRRSASHYPVRAIRIGVAVALVAALGTTAAVARARYLPESTVLPGLAIDGERVPDGADAAAVKALVEAHAARLGSRKVRLVVPGNPEPALETTLADLGLHVDVDATTLAATRAGKGGDPWTRAQAARDARAGKIDVPLLSAIDRGAAMPVVEKLKEKEDREPISARLDLDKHETVPEKDGRYIDA